MISSIIREQSIGVACFEQAFPPKKIIGQRKKQNSPLTRQFLMCVSTTFCGSTILGCAVIGRLPKKANHFCDSDAIVASANAPPPADQIAPMPEVRALEERLMSIIGTVQAPNA
jgi:hypothetical protein